MFSDPDDPIVPFLARLKTGDELDLLTMGVGLVVPQGQEIEVETQKVFFPIAEHQNCRKNQELCFRAHPISQTLTFYCPKLGTAIPENLISKIV